jgi:hypothetical protein
MIKLNLVLTGKIVAVIFIISVAYTSISMYPNYGSSYDMGFSTGSAFVQSIKFLGRISLFVYVVKFIQVRGVNRLG